MRHQFDCAMASSGNARRLRLVLATLLCGALAASASAAPPHLESRLDRDELAQNEELTFQIRLRGPLAGERPDLTPLQRDFAVLDVRQSQRQSVVNGSRDASFDWTLILAPRRAGTLEIPPLRVGPAQTPPYSVTVLPARAGTGLPQSGAVAPTTSDVFVRVKPERSEPYEGERVILRVRIYAGPDLLEGTLMDPVVAGASVERIGEDKPFREEIDGRPYRGVERTYALYPEAAGELVIPSVAFQGVVRESTPPARSGRSRRGGTGPGSAFGAFGNGFGPLDRFGGFGGWGTGDDWFEDFFSQPSRAGDLIDRFLRRDTRRISAHSEPIALSVRPRPEETDGQWWLPARAIALEEKWTPDGDEVRVGEAITRRIALHGAGVGEAQLPPLALPSTEGAKQYPEAAETSETEVGASRVQEITVIPTDPGPLLLPPVEVTWWDTDNHRLQTASLPGRRVDVLPGIAAPAAAGNTAAPSPDPSSPVAWEPETPTATASSAPNPTAPVVWVVLGLLLAVGAGMGWAAHRGSAPSPRRSLRAAERSLRAACRRSDPVAAETALRRIAGLRTGGSANLETWAREQATRELEAALAVLRGVRYAETPTEGWDGDALWKGYRGSQKRRTRSAQPLATSLPPLYPDAGEIGEEGRGAHG